MLNAFSLISQDLGLYLIQRELSSTDLMIIKIILRIFPVNVVAALHLKLNKIVIPFEINY